MDSLFFSNHRCNRTGNQCGTDTQMLDRECQCPGCLAFRAEYPTPKTIRWRDVRLSVLADPQVKAEYDRFAFSQEGEPLTEEDIAWVNSVIDDREAKKTSREP